ncbi:MAG: penicillin-binding transpeptidase domain-containing protein [Clostridium sp.]|nr:penicillin-binding transpeptidase domain-containing protein [Clostridium sp.]MCM1547350.1 penicillin-binding transpeptidase domain-containing protein [Ruminococcus sp.]
MKSLKRGRNLISVIILLFLSGIVMLIVKIQTEASFYISNSGSRDLGYIYDCNGDIIFDDNAKDGDYPDGYFKDVGNLVGDAGGQMTNTLVANNLERLSNYSFTKGITRKGGKAAVYTSLDHSANEKVYSAFGGKDGCAIAYNYKTGEILICVSKPNVDPLKGYDDLEEGSLLCKAFYETVPGSTQKISTLIAAIETMGIDHLRELSFSCEGRYRNQTGEDIICHNSYGHGTQIIDEAFQNSCNPFFAQLVESPSWKLSDIENAYKKMGYSVNETEYNTIDINGISAGTASTELTDKYEFNTQWGCIGQGMTMVSPCQLMMWQSAIANESGRSTMPYLIDHVTNVSGRIVETADTTYSDQLFSAQTASQVKEIMLENGLNYSGTIPGYTIGVKSGTAQVKNGAEENSLLTGFVDDESLPVAFAVLIENRSQGDITTDSIVSTILSSLA